MRNDSGEKVFFCRAVPLRPYSTVAGGGVAQDGDTTLHVQALRAEGREEVEVTDVGGLERLIAERQVRQVLFYFHGSPRRAVPATAASRHMARLVRVFAEHPEYV